MSDELEYDAVPRRRRMDTSAGDARRAIEDLLTPLEPMRSRVAVIGARATHALSIEVRQSLGLECDDVVAACQQARVQLLERLADQPATVAGHSRVADLERAIDNLDTAAKTARRQLDLPT